MTPIRDSFGLRRQKTRRRWVMATAISLLASTLLLRFTADNITPRGTWPKVPALLALLMAGLGLASPR